MYRKVLQRVPLTIKAGLQFRRGTERWAMVFREGGRGLAENRTTKERIPFQWEDHEAGARPYSWFKRRASRLFYSQIVPQLRDPLMLGPIPELWCADGCVGVFEHALAEAVSAVSEVWNRSEHVDVHLNCTPNVRASLLTVEGDHGRIDTPRSSRLGAAISELLSKFDVRGCVLRRRRGSGTRVSHYDRLATTAVISIPRPKLHVAGAARTKLLAMPTLPPMNQHAQ